MFKAELFNPQQWADVFARSGAKYVALTSKHHEGFACGPVRKRRGIGDGRGTAWMSARTATCWAI